MAFNLTKNVVTTGNGVKTIELPTTMTTATSPSGLIRLDVACGTNKQPGWVGIDIVAVPGVDIVHDLLSFPWPLHDESVYELRAIQYLEHIPMQCLCCRDQPDPLLATFDEFYRILVPGGIARIACPHSSNTLRTWRDPTHRRAINEETFLYANRDMRARFGVSHYPVRCNFDMTYGFVYDEHGNRQDLHVELIKR